MDRYKIFARFDKEVELLIKQTTKIDKQNIRMEFGMEKHDGKNRNNGMSRSVQSGKHQNT